MIHIFNRKELITTVSAQQLYRVRSALDAAGVAHKVKFCRSVFTADRYRGMPLINQGAEPAVIYVKKTDYSRALAAVSATE